MPQDKMTAIFLLNYEGISLRTNQETDNKFSLWA